MPALIAVLINGLRILLLSRAGLFIASALAWLGLNFGTMKVVVGPVINQLRGFTTGISAGGSDIAVLAQQWAGVMQVDRAVTMIISAVVVKHAVMQGRLFLFKRGVGAP